MARPRVTERQFMDNVMRLARLYKWKVYHTHDSRRSVPGYPDLTMVRGERLIYSELKTERGRLSAYQEEWLAALSEVPGVESYCWRPRDWDRIVETLK